MLCIVQVKIKITSLRLKKYTLINRLKWLKVTIFVFHINLTEALFTLIIALGVNMG